MAEGSLGATPASSGMLEQSLALPIGAELTSSSWSELGSSSLPESRECGVPECSMVGPGQAGACAANVRTSNIQFLTNLPSIFQWRGRR